MVYTTNLINTSSEGKVENDILQIVSEANEKLVDAKNDLLKFTDGFRNSSEPIIDHLVITNKRLGEMDENLLTQLHHDVQTVNNSIGGKKAFQEQLDNVMLKYIIKGEAVGKGVIEFGQQSDSSIIEKAGQDYLKAINDAKAGFGEVNSILKGGAVELG